MLIIGESKLLRRFARDAEDELLAIVELFAQFKIFEGHTPGNGTGRLPVGKAAVEHMARTRQLWLSNELVSSLKVYADYKDKEFAPHNMYPLSRLHRTGEGRILVAVANDEEDPASVYPFPNSKLWHCAGCKVTQYWAKDPGTFRDDLQAVVNPPDALRGDGHLVEVFW